MLQNRCLPQLWIARCQVVSGTCFRHKPPHRTATKRPYINTDRQGNLQSHFWSAGGVFSASQNLRNHPVHLTNEEPVAQGWGMPCRRPCTGDFPAGPAVTTLRFHCGGMQVRPFGELRSPRLCVVQPKNMSAYSHNYISRALFP